jgi:hypothetical protein
MIGDIIFGLLSVDTNVVSIVDNRIYAVQIPQLKPFPAIVFNQISNVPTNTKGADGASTMDTIRIQITCLGESYSQIELLASYVRNAIDYRFLQTTAGSFIYNIAFLSENQAFDSASGQDGIYLKYQDYQLTIKR